MATFTETWPRCTEAATFFQRQLDTFASANPLLEAMAERFLQEAGVRLLNLVDHWIFPEDATLNQELLACGMVEMTLAEGDRVWRHPQARLPRVRFKSKLTTPRLSLLVEDIPFFAQCNGLELESCHGDPDSQYQCGHIDLPKGELMPITRHGYRGFAPGTLTASDHAKREKARNLFRNRRREGEEAEVLEHTLQLAERVIAEIGQDLATDVFFETEREYYLSRNAAARWQYAQQQKIGIGWANHDHHTYRCSRSSFRALMRLWQTFGFDNRERFYAGAEAGWGAQVAEHPVSRIILFSDVDMAPEELDLDFTQTGLPPQKTLV